MVEQVKAYRSRDGQVHNNKMSSQMTEFKLDIQSFCNRHGNNGVTTRNEFPPQRIAEMISSHTIEFMKLVANHTRCVNRINRSKTPILNKSQLRFDLHG